MSESSDVSTRIPRPPNTRSDFLLNESFYFALERFKRLVELWKVSATAVAVETYALDRVVRTGVMRKHLIVADRAKGYRVLQVSAWEVIPPPAEAEKLVFRVVAPAFTRDLPIRANRFPHGSKQKQ